MASPINGNKMGHPIDPGRCGAVNKVREEIGELTTADINKDRYDWAKGDAAAKTKGVATKASGSAVGPQFSAKRS